MWRYSGVNANLFRTNPEGYFTEVLNFLCEFKWLHDFKITRFYVDHIYENLPAEWLKAFEDLSDEDLQQQLTAFANRDQAKISAAFPKSLQNFLCATQDLSLDRVPSLELPNLLSHNDDPREVPRHLTRGMSDKKKHEVSQMAAVVSSVCKHFDLTNVIDFGSGMGYLDCVLCEMYDLTVTAVESDDVRTQSAKTRAEKWSRTARTDALHHHTLKITADQECLDNLRGILTRSCHNKQVCMVGLHCCGDFTPILIDKFAALESARVLVCVGCCYHLMQYSESHTAVNRCPLSSIARTELEQVWPGKEPLLNTFSLRLATQETKVRWLKQLDCHIFCHSFRGILECAAEEENVILRKRKRHTNYAEYDADFDRYVEFALKNFLFNDTQDLEQFRKTLIRSYIKCSPHFRKLRIFRILQGLLQGVLESFIVIDRYVYAKIDKNCSHVEVIPLFDDTLSPRNLALVVVK